MRDPFETQCCGDKRRFGWRTRRTKLYYESPSGNASQFVEFQVPQLNGGANLVVDLLGREGEQVRIELSGLSGMEVVALAQTLWKRPS